MYFLLALFRILTLANKHIGNLQSKWIDLNIVKYYYANSLPNNTIFNWSKLKAFADDKKKKKKKKKKKIEIEICFRKGRKHCGKRRKCWLQAFSPFPTMFSEGFFLRVVKSGDCVVKS